MKSFAVKVRTAESSFSYIALATHSFDVWDAAVERFGICKVTVRAT